MGEPGFHQQQQTAHPGYHFSTGAGGGRIRRLSSDDSAIRYYPSVMDQADQHFMNQREWRTSNDDNQVVYSAWIVTRLER